jgi:hypothetical protein
MAMLLRSPKLRAAFLAIVVACGGLVALDASEATAAPTTKTPVMGPSILTAAQLAAWYKSEAGTGAKLPSLGNNVAALAQIFIDEGKRDGVRGDIAFVQSMLETGWLRYEGSQIIPSANNYAGIYAYNGRSKIVSCADDNKEDADGGLPSRCFSSPNIGVRMQIQLLRSYADPAVKSMSGRLIKAPSDRAGMAPIWEYFGGHNCPCNKLIWASSDTYPVHILQLYSEALRRSGKGGACVPYGGSGGASGKGYFDVTSDRVVHAFGTAQHRGDLRSKSLSAPLVGGASTGAGGYWLLGRDGGIFTFGNAKYFGSTGGRRLNQPVNGMERTSDSGGYWLVADDGGIFTFGNAKFRGSMGNKHLNQPILGMERTVSGKGYWLFARDGGLFTFGDAFFAGSLGAKNLKYPVVAMQRPAVGKGYWMLTLDGRVYSFGTAGYYGDVAACKNFGGAVRLLPAPDGKGYWIATGNGAIIPFGSARNLGFPKNVGGYTVALLSGG